MDEWDVPLEETGEFDQQNEEGTSSADAGWKDELNLAEFPIAALTDRIPDGQTTMVFEDRLERRDSAPIVRRLTIMGTHKHGLPTSLDDEVLVGLIQLTKRRSNFTDARVQFSRYELIELLGWPQSGQSYRRIEEALHRWVGVVLMYENAWWDNMAKSWVDEQFHVLDNVTLYDRERWRTSARSGKVGQGGSRREGRQAPPALVQLPLERGDLPELSERQPQAARPGVLPQAEAADDQADVPVPGQAVLPPVAAGLRPADPGLRAHRLEPFVRADRTEATAQAGPGGAGAARVSGAAGPRGAVFVRQARLLADHLHPRPPRDGRGAGPRRARGATARRADRGPQGARGHGQDGPGAGRGTPHGRIRTKIEVFDWLLRNEDRRVGKNPAGYLVASIRSDYQAPAIIRPRPPRPRRRARPRRRPRPRRSATRSRPATPPSATRPARPAPRRLGAAARGRARGDPRRGQGREPRHRRWKNMLEPLCLAALEARMNQPAIGTDVVAGPRPAPASACSSPTPGPSRRSRMVIRRCQSGTPSPFSG